MNEGELVGPWPTGVRDQLHPARRLGHPHRRGRPRLGPPRAPRPAQVWLDAYPGDTLKAEVSEIAEVADPLTGTFSVKLRIGPANVASRADSSHASACSPRARRNSDRTHRSRHHRRPRRATLFSLRDNGKTVASAPCRWPTSFPTAWPYAPKTNPLRTVVTDGASYLHDGETVTVLR